MKILSITTFVPGDDAAGLRVSHIAKALRSGGHDVRMVHYVRRSTYENLMKDELNDDHIPNLPVMVSKASVHIKHLRELGRNKYDLVYGNTHSGTFCSLGSRLKGVPLVFDMHGGLVEEFLLNNPSGRWVFSPKLFELLLDRAIDFLDLHLSSKIICVSNKMIEYFHAKKGIPLDKMACVTNGVDLELFKPQRGASIRALKEELGLGNKFVFGYIGGFQRWQGVGQFIDTVERVRERHIAFLVLGGTEKYWDGNILFLPRLPRSQLAGYYSICDVLVLPRPSHPAIEIAAPTKFAEYTAMGKPILATDVGDAAGLIRKYNCGIVVRDNSPTSLAEGVMQFESKPADELRVMGKNSRMLAERELNWGEIANKLLRVIEGML